MLSPHPLRHIGLTSCMSNDTRLGKGSLSAVIRICKTSPTFFVGSFYWCGTAADRLPNIKEDIFMQKRKSLFTIKRLVLDALLIALYVVLGFWKIPIGNILRISLASFAVVVCAVAFSPLDGLVVGFMGEFLSQVLGPYGLTPTTALWALPEGVRGLLLGCIMLLFIRKNFTASRLLKSKVIFFYLLACIMTGIIASLFNTFALYVDSKMYGYYNYYMVFGVLVTRLGIATVMSGIFGYVTLHIVSALKKTKII